MLNHGICHCVSFIISEIYSSQSIGFSGSSVLVKISRSLIEVIYSTEEVNYDDTLWG